MPGYNKRVDIPGKSSQELFDTVARELEKLMAKLTIGDAKITPDASSKQVHLKASLVTATLHCRDGELELDAKLSLMAMPFRSKIDEGINKWLAKTFNVQV